MMPHIRAIGGAFMLLLSATDSLAKPLDKPELWAQAWLQLDSQYTLASRFLTTNETQITGEYLSESTLQAYHSYQEFIVAWRVNNLLYQAQNSDSLRNDIEFELSELSWSHGFLDSGADLWQIGKFNLPIDPGYAFQSTGFFESKSNPFDDFSASEGIPMISTSIWLQERYLSAVIALEGQGQAYQDLAQWGLIMQTDFAALSTSLIVQAYQESHPGLGATFTYVRGESWELHGSSFIRKGSVWRSQLTDNQTLAEKFANRDNAWLPSLVLGSVWTTQAQQLLVEWRYQKEKLSKGEIDTLNKISENPHNEVENPDAFDALAYQNAIINLYHQRYQRQYLFLQYQFTKTDHNITSNALIGLDRSALSQVKYEYLASPDIRYWVAFEITSGNGQAEFTQIPWQNRLQIGLQWKI